MTTNQLDHLDAVAESLKGNRARGAFGVLSTGEKLYVALAANRADLLAGMRYTIAEALARLGGDDIVALARRWQYRD
jgi:hypothetical protein